MARAPEYRSRVRGCLLGGAIGDALGGPVEFNDTETILSNHPDGVRRYVDGGGYNWPPGTVTDDTQMTLFTVEGLIRAQGRSDRGAGFTLAPVHHAYDRWLDTQELRAPSGNRDGWLQSEHWLYARRAPGNTCLSALGLAREGGDRIPRLGGQAVNDSKGCGGVMRAAPFGLLPGERFGREWAFAAAAESAGYTHGHATGKLASGALAVLIREICQGADLSAALDTTQSLLAQYPAHFETSTALAAARSLAASGTEPGPQAVEQLGGGWIAEEALAIGVYAALVHDAAAQPTGNAVAGPSHSRSAALVSEQIADALALAVTHSGDSDSTGAICGNILGALYGEGSLPSELVAAVEGRAVIVQLADDLVTAFMTSENPPSDSWRTRYPAS